MKEIVKVLLAEGISEEVIHEVLDIIQEMDNPEKKHNIVHNERVRRSKQAQLDQNNANRASGYLSMVKDPETRGSYGDAQHELEKVVHRATMKKYDADSKLRKADELIKRHSHKVLGKKASMSPDKQGVAHSELTGFDKEWAEKHNIY